MHLQQELDGPPNRLHSLPKLKDAYKIFLLIIFYQITHFIQYSLLTISGKMVYCETTKSSSKLRMSGKKSVVMGKEAGMVSDFQSTPIKRGQENG